MTTVSCEAHGLGFDIRSSDTEVAATFGDLLSDMRRSVPLGSAGPTADHRIDIEPLPHPDGDEPWFTVRFDGVAVHATLIEGSLVSHVLMAINQRVAAAVRSSGSIPLHASSVAGTRGALVLAGASQSGKTTLAAALAVTGQQVEFLADEVSAIDPTELTIAAYGKPAALRMPGRALLAPHVERLRREGSRFETDERFVPPSELGARPTTTPARVAAIVFPRFDANTAGSGIELTSVGPADALTRLIHLTLGSEPVDLATFRSLEHLVRTVDAVEVRYADAISAAEQLLAVLEGRSAGGNEKFLKKSSGMPIVKK